MVDLQSIFVYVGLAFLSFLIAKYAEYTGNKKMIWFIVIVLSLTAGFRAVTVGIDTKTYSAIFDLLPSSSIYKIYNLERGFIIMTIVLKYIWDSSQFIFFVYALITHGLVIFSFWGNRKYISFRWAVFSYYIAFFTMTLNGMRQFVAVAIVIYAISMVRKGKYLMFIAFIIIASFFHKSAFIGFTYLLFEMLFIKHIEEKKKTKIFFFVGIAIIATFVATSQLMSQYRAYFDTTSSSFGIMTIAKTLLLIASIFILEKPVDKEEKYICYTYRWYYFIGLLLNSLSYIFIYAGRIGLYFFIFEAFYIGYVFKAKNRTIEIIFIKAAYLSLLMFFLYGFFANGQGEIPYRFYWQE